MTNRHARAWRLGPLAALLAILLLAPAWAAPCEDCDELNTGELQQIVNPYLATRSGGFLGLETSRDYFEMDVGECTHSLEDTIEPHMLNSRLVLRAHGEVWDCPHSKSSMAISAAIAKEDRTEWSESAAFEGTMKALAAEMKLKYERARGGSDSITETTDLSQTLTAAYCHRIPWLAYLEVGDFEVTWVYRAKRIYAWWTKNSVTGATVHLKGKYTQDCGTFDVTLARKAPLSWTLHLAQDSCGAGCGILVTPKDLGFWPQLPPYHPEPPVPDGIDWPDDADDGPGTADEGDGDGEPAVPVPDDGPVVPDDDG